MTSKNKPAAKVLCKKDCCTDDPKSFVFLVKLGALEGTIVCLRHPQKSVSAYFMLASSQKVYEVLSYNDPYRSFFVNDTIQSDGKIFFTSVIDPILLALPYLQSNSRCTPIDHILTDDEYPEVEKLIDYLPEDRLAIVADVKGNDSLKAFKYNEEKTLSWLSGKVKKVAELLKKEEVHVGSNSSVSANFVKGVEDKDSEESYLAYGFNIIGDYLNEDLKKKLSQHMNIDINQKVTKRKRNGNEDPDLKKIKVENKSPKAVTSNPLKPKTPTQNAKEKARVKAAAGSKSISSFFQKKT